jgi:hypothetical protein
MDATDLIQNLLIGLLAIAQIIHRSHLRRDR